MRCDNSCLRIRNHSWGNVQGVDLSKDARQMLRQTARPAPDFYAAILVKAIFCPVGEELVPMHLTHGIELFVSPRRTAALFSSFVGRHPKQRVELAPFSPLDIGSD